VTRRLLRDERAGAAGARPGHGAQAAIRRSSLWRSPSTRCRRNQRSKSAQALRRRSPKRLVRRWREHGLRAEIDIRIPPRPRLRSCTARRSGIEMFGLTVSFGMTADAAEERRTTEFDRNVRSSAFRNGGRDRLNPHALVECKALANQAASFRDSAGNMNL
jgi:hypothetical protein